MKRIVTVCLVVCVVLLIGCVKNNYDSFAEVYERIWIALKGCIIYWIVYPVQSE